MSKGLRTASFPKVSIIILNWNGLKDTLECLESLKKTTYSNYEVVVVDNGSKGNDAEVLRQTFGNHIHIISNDENHGFAEGNNIAIRYILGNGPTTDYFLLLNNDTVVAAEFLTEMVRMAESNPQIGIVGPKVYYYDFPDVLQGIGNKIDLCTGTTAPIGFKQRDVGQFDEARDVDYVTGCSMLIKKQVVQTIGLLDKEYFCYYEETDYCLRAKRAGFKVIFVPGAKIWHKKQLVRRWPGALEEKASALSYYYWSRNVFIFMKKHATQRQLCSFILYLFGYRVWIVCAVCLIHHRNVSQLKVFFRGLVDGLIYLWKSPGQ